MSHERVEMIRERLTAFLDVQQLDIADESHLHAGHAGARAGGGHFRVTVISADFAGKNPIQRHRLVYQAMGDAIRPDCIHALNIKALTPDEAQHPSQ